ncbi:selenocysteine-specific translation elongation factor [Vagococcus acidifermentans]|uniref:Selenocysteine-specific elongation factor n=1 Tax=Vagococcus acidifermentans TaxID=564710 RepID=A0A430B385_9ENTE|nr:selenocysteine-specific translation elongation factor [Vagococcus acidifermentans]RSU14806.1 selenocysteine-specific translation elongation factor [Vagococcus acidifermentans]
MTDIVIGTAGHVDHGKTTLIKALTGIETDTTKEEKKRGLSINLGFAYLDLPNNKRVGIVDVPGHERFIKNMVAGLPGIGLILLVVDASEGIMPQTKEHIAILSLLGKTNFLIVLTKVDSVDEEMRELVIEDIQEQVQGTVLEGADIVETDAVTGYGLDNLIAKIEQFTEEEHPVSASGNARLNIDRVFSVKGFGTVVTGTLLDGPISVGDTLYSYATGNKVTVRNIQVHEQNCQQARPGQRTALNLSNVSKQELKRGDVLSRSDQIPVTWMVDVKVTCLPEAQSGIGLWERVRLLIGTKEVLARTVPIGVDDIAPGEEGFLQLRLEEQIVAKQNDRFILRSYSPMMTIGGGQIIDASPKKHRRFRKEVLDSLKIKEEGSLDQLVLDFLMNKKNPFTEVNDLSEFLNKDTAELQHMLEQLQASGEVIRIDDQLWLHPQQLDKLNQLVGGYLDEYHKKYRLRKGMPIEEVRSKLRHLFSNREIDYLLDELVVRRALVSEQHRLSLPDFKVVFNKYQLAAWQLIEKELAKSGFTPVKAEDLLSLDKNAPDVLEAMTGEQVILLTHEYVISKEYYDKAVSLVREYIGEHQEMTLADFRDMTQSSRKTSMLILEYLDKNNVTKRIDNKRVLVD